MKSPGRIILIAIGTLLVLNGLANILDDTRVLTYDITSILAGGGFITVSLSFRKMCAIPPGKVQG